MKRLLAIDLGARRVGLAGTDDSGLLALPIGTLPEERKPSDRLRRLMRLGAERGVEGYLVGLPLETSGTAGASAQAARTFAQRLAEKTGLPVMLIDERLTSVEADELMRQAGTKAGRGDRDAMSALVLLRAYQAGARGERIEASS